MIDHSGMRLGKKAAVFDPRTLKLHDYVRRAALPPLPAEVDYIDQPSLQPMQMYANDRYGDCAMAGPAHQEKAWTFLSGAPDFEATEQQVIDDYFRMSGGVDSGLVLLEVMKEWRTNGFFGGHKIDAFAAIDLKNTELVQHAIHLFGSITIGLALPLAAQELDVWDVPAQPAPQPRRPPRWRRWFGSIARKLLLGRSDPWAPNSWGGHCVPLMGYVRRAGQLFLKCCTWGATKLISPPFLAMFGDEGYVPLTKDWLDVATQVAPNGFKRVDLMQDLNAIAA